VQILFTEKAPAPVTRPILYDTYSSANFCSGSDDPGSRNIAYKLTSRLDTTVLNLFPKDSGSDDSGSRNTVYKLTLNKSLHSNISVQALFTEKTPALVTRPIRYLFEHKFCSRKNSGSDDSGSRNTANKLNHSKIFCVCTYLCKFCSWKSSGSDRRLRLP
jgi:hypothetical protein